MGGIRLSDALAGIQATQVKARKEGLADLRYVLEHNRRSTSLKTLADKNYLELLKELFDIIRAEKSNFLKRSKGSEDRLSTCADALRIIVEHGVTAFRRKHTAPALLSHILLTLPVHGGHLCEPIAKQYTKVLRVFLEYKTHAEHLSEEEWRELVSLCLGAIGSKSDGREEEDLEDITGLSGAGKKSGRGSRSGTPNSVNVSFRSVKQPMKRSPAGLADQTMEDVFACLSLLLSVPHFPVLDVSGTAYQILCDYLQDIGPTIQLQCTESIFRSLNVILSCSMTEDLTLAKSVVQRGLTQVRRLWHAKTHQRLKEQMLLFISQCMSLVEVLLTEDPDFQDEVERLVKVLQTEYVKRKELDVLSCDELTLIHSSADKKVVSMGNPVFRLRLGSSRGEQAWALLSSTAKILRLLQDWKEKKEALAREGELILPSKRRKTESPMDLIIQSAKTTRATEKAAWLQLLAFVAFEWSLRPEELQKICDSVVPMISREDSTNSSWCFLVLACVSEKAGFGTHEDVSDLWMQCWKLGAQSITSMSVCRCACHLMIGLLKRNAIEYREVNDTMDSMLASVDLSGPALFCDSSSRLWRSLLEMKARYAPALVYHASQRIVSWLIVRWRPSTAVDITGSRKTSSVYDTEDIVSLITSILGLPHLHSSPLWGSGLGVLADAQAKQLADEPMICYLLANQDVKLELQHVEVEQEKGPVLVEFSDSRFQALCKELFDFFGNQTWSILSAVAPSSGADLKLDGDSFRLATQLGIVALSVLSDARVQKLAKTNKISQDINDLKRQVASLIINQQDMSLAIEDLISAFGTLLTFGSTSIASAGAREFASVFGPEFWKKIFRDDNNGNEDATDDLMVVEDSLDSQNSRGIPDTQDSSRSKRLLHSHTGPKNIKTDRAMRICLASFMKATSRRDSLDKYVPSDFFKYLTTLRPLDFLCCRDVFQDLFRAKASIDTDSALDLLEYVGRELLEPDEFERNDLALSIALEIMTGLADVWINAEGDLQSVASQLYQWFLEVALPKRILSPGARTCMASMLHKILELRPDYTKDLSLESARTSLFRIFEEGTAKVKFSIGTSISSIFNFFVLKEHDAILDDVLSSLPLELNSTEESALRIYILARLGASWSTLLRRCIYAIAEAPVLVPLCSGHAEKCFRQLAYDLGIAHPKDLFKLFAPQVIYTWLETREIKTLPFRVFGYSDLESLLHDVQSEITAQVIMRGREGEIQELSRHCQQPKEQLAKQAFGRAAAYCIARDASIRPEADEQATRGTVRLKSIVGKDNFRPLMLDHLPVILATLFKSADREESMSKGFQRRDSFLAASQAYDEILSSGASQTPLVVSQQPSFKAVFLLDEIDFLCSRSQVEVATIWSASLYVYVFRELLDFIHPALGSLHTCSVIRRLRILVSMAGEAALTGYPLEMALHALRRFLVDTQCAEDVIGLSRYLISHGFPYLQQVPSFFTGFVVSTLVSLRAFLESPRDSTTQESQYIATMSKAKEFHEWLGNQMVDYTAPLLSAFELETMKRVVDKAIQVRAAGNSRLNTPEGELLSMVLEDDQSGRKLIDNASRGLILDVLCAEFDFTPNFRDDVLGNDGSAVRCAPVLVSTLPEENMESNYYRWVSRVLGRAYAGSGHFDWKSLQGEIREASDSKDTSETHASGRSRSIVLQLLRTTLYTDNLQNVSKAEKALQSIVTCTKPSDPLMDSVEELPPSLLSTLSWTLFSYPREQTLIRDVERAPSLTDALQIKPEEPYSDWIKNLCLALACTCPNDPLLSGITAIIESIEGVAEKIFPQILHLALTFASGKQNVKRTVSKAVSHWLRDFNMANKRHVQQLFKAVLYLRTQSRQHEVTKSDRTYWLDIDFKLAAEVAAKCGMFTTSLSFLEISHSEMSRITVRRSSINKLQLPTDLLLQIYQNIDDKDSFYGIRQPSSLGAMMNQLEFENAGFKGLSFRGAYYNSQIKYLGAADPTSEEEMIKLLDTVDLNGISQGLLSAVADQASLTQEATFMTARKLERWDITGPADSDSPSILLFKAYQNIHDSAEYNTVTKTLDLGFSKILTSVLSNTLSTKDLQSNLCSLAVLTEIEDVVSSHGVGQLREAQERLQRREDWMLLHRHEDIKTIDSCRQTLFSTVSKSKDLRALMKVSEKDARIVETQAILASSGLNRRHGALQSCLNSATYLGQLVGSCAELGARVDIAINFEASNVLWDQGEMASSIRMLQDVVGSANFEDQDIHVGKPKVLATLGHRISQARLEKPDETIANYLTPAIEELKGDLKGSEAGQVFHEFASFCDQQLQDADGLEDFKRIESLRASKENELNDLDDLARSSSSQTKQKEVKGLRLKTQRWFELDDKDYQRLKKERISLLRQSLENYLRCLEASDDYDNDALRFSALWLEYSDEEVANKAVDKQLKYVPSRKFASMMNQWTSRQLDTDDDFQRLLSDLILRICQDHPYHGMFQLFTSSKSKGAKDQIALSRNAAALKVVNSLKTHKRTAPTWIAIHNSNVNYVRFAAEPHAKAKSGTKIQLSKSQSGTKMEQDARANRIPPPTMKIPLREDCDYRGVITIHAYESHFSFASGNSVPKVLTAIGTDARKYKQLFKSGNDDLRQDAIMEQVFEQVSNLLRHHGETRQRNLGIRTYKVLPLTTSAGIIEWVKDTIPLNDYLLPAHEAHFPRDLKQGSCRKAIQEAQTKPTETRIKVFRDVCEKFHPVLRYFLMDRFPDPDEWFERRLSYTRSAAAISMLGYILGLGDRHGQNILLDKNTGEVIHIDLGIAFETGRVLPIPEVVPFRLTRDIVDGMGITKTEGVFRRCCEFTLDALRKEEYSIMTILDVLRYDPLVSWSVSPLKVKRMQDDQNAVGDEDEEGRLRAQRKEASKAGTKDKSEEGEADRALTVVRKKLSKSLSVAATVNELIQQATDERNLALLFAGWAAYA